MKLNVTSEIKPLKEVLLHRPGKELENITPDNLENLLFDDIPYLKRAQQEHDTFARQLKQNGVTVVYLEDLMTEVLNQNQKIKEKFINDFICEAQIKSKYRTKVQEFLNNISNNKDLVLKTMEGIKASEINEQNAGALFITNPMPNLYFTRDNFTIINQTVNINKMKYEVRNRETIYGKYIFKYHPKYAGNTKIYYNNRYHIEGGDILNINENLLIIGISERTNLKAITELGKNIFQDKNNQITTILAINIPKKRAYMHLDTVFTQVDYDKFVYYKEAFDNLNAYEITASLKEKKLKGSLKEILEKYLNQNITLIPCASDDKIDAAREQWNDATNTLCLAPGKIIVYNRNPKTNELLKSYGLKVIEITSAELSRGRGGTRCMSMPLIREK